MSVDTDDLNDLAAALEERLRGDHQVERDVGARTLTTYRVGGPLALLVRTGTEDALFALAEVLAAAPVSVPVLVVGRGSNLLVAERGFAGVAVLLEDAFEHVDVDRTAGRARAGGAVALPVLARRAAAVGLGGLEFYVGIPGSVGGAVRMNAGGHGAETTDVLVSARVVSLENGHARELDRHQLGLGYRCSALGRQDVVTFATFSGTPASRDESLARIDDVVRWRREHQPGGQNAGSVFTNPPGDAAGRLIEQCGCKGLRVGGAVVSEKHANFFVADADASADDVRALIREVQRRVEESTGVVLHPELQMVGFDEEER